MNFLHVSFSEVDAQIAQFARAIALPVRVFIIRMIAENGNAINKQTFYNSAFDARAINKHIMELKALGIIKVKTVKAQVTYYIDQHLFDQMSAQFGLLFSPVLSAQLMPSSDSESHTPSEAEQPSCFGDYIKQHRAELNLSQESLAGKIGIDRALLSRIECGRKPFDAEKLHLLSKALFIDMSEMQKAVTQYGGVC